MKKLAIWVLGMAVVGFVALPPGAAAHEDDLKVIKKAVRESRSSLSRVR